MKLILAGLLIFTIVQIALAIFLGRFCKWGGAASDESLPPLPEGSILGKHSERVSQ